MADEDTLKFKITTDTKEAARAVAQFDRQVAASHKAMIKSNERLGKAAAKAAAKASVETDKWTQSVEDLDDSYQKQGKTLKEVEETLKALKDISAESSKAEKGNVDAQIKELEKLVKARKAAAQKEERSSKDSEGNYQKKAGMLGSKLPAKGANKEAFRKLGEELKKPLQSFLAKDAKGLVEQSLKGVGSVMFSRGTAAKALMKSRKFRTMGRAFEARGKGVKGVKGMAQRGMGKGLKGMSKVMKGLGKGIGAIAKFGPVLGLLGGFVVGLFKTFIDAQAMVKSFNKEIMQSASNIEFLGNAGGNATAGMQGLEDALYGVRDAAFSAEFNLKWGTTKDDHKAILNVLNQEGVSLGSLARQAGGTRAGMEKLTQSIVATSVAYSRALGVPMQEINQLQAEMMVEMGVGAEDTRMAFTKIARSAAESGVSATSFFGTIKGVSQDLSLWNMRMEESVDLLGQMNKVMSPRAAKKFFTDLSSGFKNMSRTDLLQQTMFAGEKKVRKIVAKDIEAKQGELASMIAKQTSRSEGEVLSALKKGGYDKAFEMIQEADVSKRGTLRGKAAEIQMQQRALSHGGEYAAGQALGDVASMGAKLEILEAQLSNMGTSLVKGYGSVRQGAVADKLNVSPEQLKMNVALRLAVDATRKQMVAAVQASDKSDGDKAKEIAEINKKGTQEMIKHIDEGVKENIKNIGKSDHDLQVEIMKAGKLQTEQTTSLVDKLGVLSEWFMNQFYGAIIGIWELIKKWSGKGDDVDQLGAIKAARATGSVELSKIASSEDIKGGLAGSQALKDIFKSQNTLESKKAALTLKFEDVMNRRVTTGAEREAQQAEVAGLVEEENKLKKVEEVLSNFSSKLDPESLVKALVEDKNIGFNKTNMSWITSKMKSKEKGGEGLTFEQAAKKSGATEEQIAKAVEKAVWHGGEVQNITAIGETQKALQKLGAVKPPESEESKANKVANKEESRVAESEESKANKVANKEESRVAESEPRKALPPSSDPKIKAMQREATVVTTTTTTTTSSDVGDPKAQEEILAATQEGNRLNSDLMAGSDGIRKALLSKGIKIDRNFLRSDMAKEQENSVLAATRKALFEYYMYQDIDKGQLAEAVAKSGGSVPDAIEYLTAKTLRGAAFSGDAGKGQEAGLKSLEGGVLKPNADGGLVTGVGGGLASVRAAAGEGLASVGRGERIVPAGGGSVSVPVNVTGVGGQDLANLIESKVVEGIREYKRRERLA